MRNKLVVVLNLILILSVLTSNAWCRDMDALLGQLCGKSESPTRSGAQLTEVYQKAVTHLLPLMGTDDVGARYKYQIMLQDMGAHAARPGAEPERQALVKVLLDTLKHAEMPNTVRYWIVLQIERIGKDESVPALVEMLSSEDANLSDCARRALQANPDPSATVALVKALDTASEATSKKGLINALGNRRDPSAVPAIAKALNSRDASISAVAVTALARISGKASAQALFPVMNKPAGRMSIAAAQGLLEIARERTLHNDFGNGMVVYAAVYNWATKAGQDPNTPNPSTLRAAALIGLIGCDVDGGAERAVEAIKDEDPTIRAAVVKAAREAPMKAPAEALAALLPELDVTSKIEVMGLVADRGDLSSVKYIKPMLDSEDESVRVEAIETLTKIGGDTAAEMLLDVAVNSDGNTRKAALDGLALTAGPLVDELIALDAASGDVKSRSIAISLLAMRRPPNVAETLLGYAAEENEDIAIASFKALAEVADLVDATKLAKLVAQTEQDSIGKSAVAALKAALSEADDKDAAAKAVIDQMHEANMPAKMALLSTLNALGGTTALKPVVEATESSHEDMRDTAIRTLSNWPDFEAAKPLLDLAAKRSTSLTHYVLATRGALRLIGADGSASLEDRAALCFQAFDQSRRDEEKRGAITVMGSLPRQDVAERLLALAQEDTFKVEAGLAAVELAGNMLRTDREAAITLAKKIREMDISEEVNNRADAVTQGRRYRRR